MARAKRHYFPGHVWHITYRCHKREFLLKFAKDRQVLTSWLFKAKRRQTSPIYPELYGYIKRILLLLADDGDRDVIPKSMQLVAVNLPEISTLDIHSTRGYNLDRLVEK